ncbi:ubiquinol-cytochrome c reductase iron-sulfur subunit [Candidatus Tokpelaia sp.]|uniref:ubiquinol-cytochrome c reductase iron-sulfur subunit n=1 Tax=Candidatus Tokpelaia sp. TaxID=2233777 RepID=UPI0012386683|nr:ubiquinol-cytochrome c reductase iron-sulfur subunit [Candidatus Tokpelaia sp.]KAA6405835.1 ubiquinol-cytochrome c reductase iron-sulfur subunit [Candidatus Tokpelaia sp.]
MSSEQDDRQKAAGAGRGAACPADYGSLERRDFLLSSLGLVGACSAAALAVPFIAQLRPDKSQAGAAVLEVDISAIAAGEQITVTWRGQPVIIRNRSRAEMAAAQKTAPSELKDRLARNANLPAGAPADDAARSGGKEHENWLVFINICTHLGCPTQKVAEGWFCPCHGSRYDMAARVVKGPANRNMAIPPYRFLSDKVIEIG